MCTTGEIGPRCGIHVPGVGVGVRGGRSHGAPLVVGGRRRRPVGVVIHPAHHTPADLWRISLVLTINKRHRQLHAATAVAEKNS